MGDCWKSFLAIGTVVAPLFGIFCYGASIHQHLLVRSGVMVIVVVAQKVMAWLCMGGAVSLLLS